MTIDEKDWYEVEYSPKGKDDWRGLSTVDPANTLVDIRIRLIRWIERMKGTGTKEHDYRIVHIVRTTDVVLMVKDEKDLTTKKTQA